jgi:hypothetical protein
MWLYTTFGFFSVVQKSSEQELTIRSRVRADLERLKVRYLPMMSEILESKSSVYPFRANVTHAAFAHAAYHIAQDIDYDNFEDASAKSQGTERAEIYEKIWRASSSLDKLNDALKSDEGSRVFGVLTARERVMMRALYSCHKHESLYTWRCQPYYAAAEKLGLVDRDLEQNVAAPEDHAVQLFLDGCKKGWLNDPLSEQEWNDLFRAFVVRFLYDRATVNWFDSENHA